MSAQTSIEWTDLSSNPLRAYHRETGKRGWFCVHASEGCRLCYAEKLNRWIGNGLHYRANNLQHVRFEMDAEELRSWGRLAPGTKVFPFDMTDLFQDAVPDSLIDHAFGAMGVSPATFQVLTKRSRRMRHYVEDWYRRTQSPLLRNVWLGVSSENRDQLERVDDLKDTPAIVRFVSFEPLLEDLGAIVLDGIHGAIFGGESGGRLQARPCDVAWIRSGVRQCREQGCAPFVKQVGTTPYDSTGAWTSPILRWYGHREDAGRRLVCHLNDRKGGDPSEWPSDLRIREFPKVQP
jgi:protein gp37